MGGSPPRAARARQASSAWPGGRELDEFLVALHGSLSLREIQTTFMRFADRLVPARAHGIYELEPGTHAPSLVQARGVSDAFLAEYEDVGRAVDPVFRRIASGGDALSSDLAWRDRAWRAEPFYEILGHGDIHHLMQAPLVVDGRLVGTINVASPAAAPPFRLRQLDRLRLVGRHVSIAYGRALRVAELERRCTLVEAVLDLLAVPLVVHAPDGELLLVNRAAERLLADPAERPAADALRAALRRNTLLLARETTRVVTATVPLERVERGAVWTPPRVRAQGPRTGLSIRSALVAGRVRAIVSFVYETPTLVPAPLPVLSAREREIVELVARGLTNREIAAAGGVSPNTVKQHLKRVFAKLQVRSRAELAATVVRAGSGEREPFAG